jgi:hypothetical protein
LAQAIGRAVIQQGYRVIYREAHTLLEELADATLDGTRKVYLADLAVVPLLIIDDLGMRKLPHTAAEDLLEVIMRATNARRVRKSVWTLVRQLAIHRGVRLSSAYALFIGMFIIYNALGMMNTSLNPDLFRPAFAKPRYPDDQVFRDDEY